MTPTTTRPLLAALCCCALLACASDPLDPTANFAPDASGEADAAASPDSGAHDTNPLDRADDAADTDTASLDTAAPLDSEPPDAPFDSSAPAMDSATPDAADVAVDTAAQDTADTFAAPPDLPHLDQVVDLTLGEQRAWGSLVTVTDGPQGPRFSEFSYGESADAVDFWPASTIKVLPATAALVLLAEMGFSLDATATFFHGDGRGGWVEDTSMTFRRMIFESFTCSSNSTYTLLLRFAGVQWLNEAFFTAAHGFTRTSLMRGYVTSRPEVYRLDEPQRIVVTEGGQSLIREHAWNGERWADEVGCTVYNGSGTANCASPRDMTEHLRRLVFHEHLTEEERFALRQDDLDWMRYGDADAPVMNNSARCGGPAWDGVARVMPDALFLHKGGLVQEYRSSLHYVEDASSGTRYLTYLALAGSAERPMRDLAEAIARAALTPDRYVHLDNLRDHVNPVTAELVVYTTEPGMLELWVKDFTADPDDLMQGWEPLDGAVAAVPEGTSAHTLASACLDRSEQVWIRGRLVRDSGDVAWSDLHYVIVDADVACP